ncbi:hypothetical protein [uncultured Maricaulis sp.]|uniref:hypothetical protein n=1 Tax=uncultured Maricaulis sp. TaxID=174710 RepID=UPI002608867A|nr:hypothetical protein [uncultured Maricaulis sp.]
MNRLRITASYLAAVLVGTFLVSLANTHIDLQALVAIGADIPLAVRLDALGRDLAGFGPTLAALTGIGFAIAFPVAGLVSRALGPGWRSIGYFLAGAVAIIVMISAITIYYRTALGSLITPVASSREISGLLMLSIGGGLSGLLFARLKPAAH